MDAVACQKNDDGWCTCFHCRPFEELGIRLVCSSDGCRSLDLHQGPNEENDVSIRCRLRLRE